VLRGVSQLLKELIVDVMHFRVPKYEALGSLILLLLQLDA